MGARHLIGGGRQSAATGIANNISGEFQIDGFEVFSFFEGGLVVDGVAGGFEFLPAAVGMVSGLADGGEKFIGADVGGAGTGDEEAIAG